MTTVPAGGVCLDQVSLLSGSLDQGPLQACCGLQVIRAREKRPNRVLFSAWLQSAYVEVPSVELKRADLDKVGLSVELIATSHNIS